MKSITGWQNNGNGDNSSGFNGLPGGARLYNGTFYDIGQHGGWWSSTEDDTEFAWRRGLGYDNVGLGWDNQSKARGYSVRCLKN